jgi:hypothetical protein
LASCTIIYSPDVARRAGRIFFWRKWTTKFGLLFLSSLVIMTVTLAIWVTWVDPDWFVGAFGMLLALNLILLGTSYFAIPRALARIASDPSRNTATIETTDDGVKISLAENVVFLTWKEISFIWVYDDFVLLVLGKMTVSRFIHIPTKGMTAEVQSAFVSAPNRLAAA